MRPRYTEMKIKKIDRRYNGFKLGGWNHMVECFAWVEGTGHRPLYQRMFKLKKALADKYGFGPKYYENQWADAKDKTLWGVEDNPFRLFFDESILEDVKEIIKGIK